ncbi:MAG: hypothetical protein AAGA75_08620 [Cyanobacteria bacterium P01_E01_bin.6]
MYKNDSKKDWLSAVIMAGLGAGVATSFAVGQGQDPMLAGAITVFAIAAALLIDRVL